MPSSVVPARGPSSVLTTVPSGVVTGVISRSQKPSAMAFSARFCERTANSSISCAGDVLEQREVLRGLAHRDVDVGELAVARAGRSRCRRRSRPPSATWALRVGEDRVLGVGQARRCCPSTKRDTISTPAEMKTSPSPALMACMRHAGGLQRGGAVAGDRGAGQVVHAEQDRDDAAHVEALLAAGQAAAEHQVVDVARVERGHLVQRGAHDRGGQVVGAQVLERPLERAADGGAGGGDDDGFGHGTSTVRRLGGVRRVAAAYDVDRTPF